MYILFALIKIIQISINKSIEVTLNDIIENNFKISTTTRLLNVNLELYKKAIKSTISSKALTREIVGKFFISISFHQSNPISKMMSNSALEPFVIFQIKSI